MKTICQANAAVAGAAAFGTLAMVALLIAGPEHELKIIGSASPLFLAISALAAGMGALPKAGVRYLAALIGMVTGLLGAGGILLYAISGI